VLATENVIHRLSLDPSACTYPHVRLGPVVDGADGLRKAERTSRRALVSLPLATKGSFGIVLSVIPERGNLAPPFPSPTKVSIPTEGLSHGPLVPVWILFCDQSVSIDFPLSCAVVSLGFCKEVGR
jgi:hypothetical protein